MLVNACYLCKKAEESCDHLLLWCSMAFSLWMLTYKTLGIDWVMVGSVKEELLAWKYLHWRYPYCEVMSLTII